MTLLEQVEAAIVAKREALSPSETRRLYWRASLSRNYHQALRALDLAALRGAVVDAERYRWFKSRSHQANMMGERPFWTTDFVLNGTLDFDAAIDAAMQEERIMKQLWADNVALGAKEQEEERREK